MIADLFHIGPQKSATTWVYNCMAEHEGVFVPDTNTIHYYDMMYHRGEKWYASFFEGARCEQVRLDPTMTYIRSPWAPRRIVSDTPNARIMVCLRNPVDRAFSHYWHEKKKGNINFEFGEVLQNYDLYSSWIEPGLYAEHLERYLEHFDRDQILCLRFETLKKDEREFVRKICQFAGIDDNFEPSWLNKKSNEAEGRRTFTNKVWRGAKKAIVDSGLEPTARDLRLDDLAQYLERIPIMGTVLQDKQEYEKGMDQALRCELIELCEPEVRRLEDLLDEDFSHWLSV